MRHVKVHEAKTQLSKLLALVEDGEHIVIDRGNTAVAKLVPVDSGEGAARRVGFLAGDILIPDDLENQLRDLGKVRE